MKYFKKILFIIMIFLIIYLLFIIYSKLKKDNIRLDLSMFLGDYNSVMNLSSSNNTNGNNILISDESKYNTSSHSNIANHFYYNQLDSNAKIIYHKLEENIPNLKTTNYKIDFSTQFNTLLNQSGGSIKLENSFQSATNSFIYDHPELFYIDLTKVNLLTKSQSFGSKTTYYVSIVPQNNTNYLSSQFTSESQLNQAISQVENMKNSFINGTSGDDYHKVLQVHDTLVDLLDYDTTYQKLNTHNIYGALVEKSVVCEGYAKSFKYILDALNIPCILVAGTATNSSGKTESHMWNYVQLDGSWYGVDVTWDDPIVFGGLIKNTIRHDYLCKSASVFQSHFISNRISDNGMLLEYPKLSQDNYQ